MTYRPQGTFPLTTFGSVNIKSGHNNIVAVSATIVTAKDGLSSLMPDARNCLFSYENAGLKMHKNYSKSNCLFECFFLSAQETMKRRHNNNTCIPWFFPKSGEINSFSCLFLVLIKFDVIELTKNSTKKIKHCKS